MAKTTHKPTHTRTHILVHYTFPYCTLSYLKGERSVSRGGNGEPLLWLSTRQGPGRTQCHFHCQTHYTRRRTPPCTPTSPTLMSLFSSAVMSGKLSRWLFCAQICWTHTILSIAAQQNVCYSTGVRILSNKRKATENRFFLKKKKEKPEGTEKALFLNERCSRNIKEYNQVIVDNHGRRTAKSIKT